MKQNINILLRKIKKFVVKIYKIQTLSLNIQIIRRMSIKILKNSTQAKNVMY